VRTPTLLIAAIAAAAFFPSSVFAQVEPDTAPAIPEADAPVNPPVVRQGEDAFADWTASKPGVQWLIRPSDLPAPFETQSASNPPGVSPRPEEAAPEAPEGYRVNLFAEGLQGPRKMAVAPNGDIFLAESPAGRLRVMRFTGGDTPSDSQIFASGLNRPYGIAFYPVDNPQYVYVAETNRVVRFAYRPGDLTAGGGPEVIVDGLPTGGHWTRDIAFSPDGTVLYIAVGSASNVAQGQPPMNESEIEAFQKQHGIGASWGSEERRAVVLAVDPDGKNLRPYATGIRNCSGLAVEATTGAPWCATNERDGLGDNLPPDYVTRVQEGGFYGWPWYYIGANEDPRHKSARPDLARYVVAPDVLIQPHSAPLGITFYRGEMFPADVVGDAFVALHGSWNRGKRTGYKVVRLLFESGQPIGVYEDFLTGFVDSDAAVWGRPVGVAVAADGSLLVSEDGSGTIWRVSHAPVAQPASNP
jgi:glucose/arabinose dehydrogenase